MALTQDVESGFSKAGSILSDVREDSPADYSRCDESNVRSIFNGGEDSVGVVCRNAALFSVFSV